MKGHGRSAYADTDADLTDAFLKVATRVLRLPAFQRFVGPGRLQEFGPASRSLLILLGPGHPSTGFGENLLKTSSVQVFDASRLHTGDAISWEGKATVFYCRHEDLHLRPTPELPSVGLLDQIPQLSFRLFNGNSDQSEAFFLQSSELQILATSGDAGTSQAMPLPFSTSDGFTGPLRLPAPGLYQLEARLRAPYGDLEQYIGKYRASSTAVDIPRQVSLGVFPGIPNWLLRTNQQTKLLLPLGSATVNFAPSAEIELSRSTIKLLPNESSTFQIWSRTSNPNADLYEVPYTVSWSDGHGRSEKSDVLRLAVKRLSLADLLRSLWGWIAASILLIFALSLFIKSFAPRSLQGKLQIAKHSNVIFSQVLPHDIRTRRIEIRSNRSIGVATRRGEIIEIPGDADELLATLESRRVQGKWDAIVRPGATRIEVSGRQLHGEKPMSEIPRSQLHIPAQDLTITFR